MRLIGRKTWAWAAALALAACLATLAGCDGGGGGEGGSSLTLAGQWTGRWWAVTGGQQGELTVSLTQDDQTINGQYTMDGHPAGSQWFTGQLDSATPPASAEFGSASLVLFSGQILSYSQWTGQWVDNDGRAGRFELAK